MSEENNNLEENTNDKLENLKEDAKESFEQVKEKAEEIIEDVKESTEDFTTETKKTANDFSEGLSELTSNQENKKIMAGVLAIVLGYFGVHKFILGYKTEGIIMLAVSLVGFLLCGIPTLIVGVVSLVEGIIYLTKSDEEFYQTYQENKKPWF